MGYTAIVGRPLYFGHGCRTHNAGSSLIQPLPPAPRMLPSTVRVRPLLSPFLLSPLTAASVSTEEFEVFGPSHPVVAELGGEAVLPCSVSPAVSLESMEELRWFRARFSEAVFVYRNRQEQKREQRLEYSGRTSLVKDQFHQGRAAVRIGNIRQSDSGIYICFFKQGVFYEEAILELKVAVMGSVPEVYIKGPEDGGLCVVCRASGWYPKPQVQWRDSRGETLPASPETHSEGAEGLFTVETSMVVRNSSLGNVTCSASNPTLGQEKAMAIVIPEPFFPQTSPWVPAFAITMTVMGLLVLGSCCLLRRERCSRRQLRQERERLQSEKQASQATTEETQMTTRTLHRELDRRKAAYMAAWRKAQLYADWRKEHFQAWPVTLDPDSAHPILAISQDRMQVTLTDNTMCLDDHFSVLGMEGISSGRCYWKVKIKNGDCSKWILGVCRGDVERKGLYFESPEKGFWTVGRSSSGYWAYIDTGRTLLSFRKTPQCVGVFVDYSEGDISFYNMSDLSHIFSFHKASFSGTLLPYFRIKSGSVWMSLCSIAQACDGEEGEGRSRRKERSWERGKNGKKSILSPLKQSLSPPGEMLTPGSIGTDCPPGEESPFLPHPGHILPS